jgi:hypothetical protein
MFPPPCSIPSYHDICMWHREAYLVHSLQWLNYRLGNRGMGVRYLGGSKTLLFSTASIATAEATQPPIGSLRGWSFLAGKAVGVWRWPIISKQCQNHKCVELYLNSPDFWCLKTHRNNYISQLHLLFIYLFIYYLLIYSFIYSKFNDIVSSSEHTASNGRKISE